jgi:hypothetical protein
MRSYVEMLSMISLAGAPQYKQTYSQFLRNSILVQLYLTQPGDSAMFHFGNETEAPWDARAGITNRQMMLNLMLLHRGSSEAGYAKQWIEERFTSLDTDPDIGHGYNRMFPFTHDRSTFAQVDYRNFLPTFFHADGSDYFFSRSDWTDTADSLSTYGGRLIEDHTHRSFGGVYLYKGDPSDYKDGWLISGGPGYGTESPYLRKAELHPGLVFYRQWSRFDNEFVVLPPAANMEAAGGGPNYHYVRVNMTESAWGDGAYTGSADFQICDYAARDIFRILPNFIVVHDRAQQVSGWQGFNFDDQGADYYGIEQNWLFPNPDGGQFPSMLDHTIKHTTAEGKRVFVTFLEPTLASANTELANMAPNPDVWAVRWRHNSNPQLNRFVTLIEPTTDTQATATDNELIFGSLMLGAVVYPDATTAKVVMFVSTLDGSISVGDSYTAPSKTNNTHFIAGLKPNQGYDVTATVPIANTYLVTWAESASGNIVTGDDGVLEFDPGNIPTTVGETVVVNELFAFDDATVAIATTDAVTVSESFSLDDTFVEVSVGTTEVAVVVEESFSLDDSTIILGDHISVDEHFLLGETVVIATTGGEDEKSIPVYGATVVPSDDLSRGFVTPEPDDDAVWDKLTGTVDSPDWNTFVTFGQSFPWLVRVLVGLATPTNRIGRPDRVKMRAAIRSCQLNNAQGVALRMTLVRRSDSRAMATADLTLSDGNTYTLESDWFPTLDVLDSDMALQFTLPATTYDYMAIEVAAIDIVAEGSGLEKVIP